MSKLSYSESEPGSNFVIHLLSTFPESESDDWIWFSFNVYESRHLHFFHIIFDDEADGGRDSSQWRQRHITKNCYLTGQTSQKS